MDGGRDACRFQGRLNGIAVFHAHGVLGIRADIVAFDKRCGDAGFIQFLRVNGGNPAAQADFFFQNRQFGQQDGGLQRVQTAVYADADMVLAAVLAVARDLADDGGQIVVVGKNRAAVAVAAQRFAGEEAGAGNSGQAA